MMTTDQQIKCFGETTDEIMQQVSDRSEVGLNMHAMGLLSDAQEMLARGQVETARQWINQAKYLMGLVNSGLREKGM